ncbi:MAG: BirA family biotin operon repressor/biotin-[acetyl-CoA-carboxylase] ligase [Maribacter sp.]
MNTRLNTLFLGKVLLEYERLDSTNSQAERLLKEKKPAEGTVVFTMEQYSGRGQMGNSWFSDSFKNLATSIILYPKIDFPSRQFALNQVIALGVRDCLSSLDIDDVKVKWPNDIMIGHRKVAGVLIQNAISRKRISHSIVGIGINVNQDHFPDNIGEPTSLYVETKQSFDIREVLNLLCVHIEYWYLKLNANRFDEINDEYHAHLYLKDESHLFKDSEGNTFEGKITGIDENGMLEINTIQGVRSFMFKEVSLVK